MSSPPCEQVATPHTVSFVKWWLGRGVLLLLVVIIVVASWWIIEGYVTGRNRLQRHWAVFHESWCRVVVEAEVEGDQFDDSAVDTLLWYRYLEAVSLSESKVTDESASRLKELTSLTRVNLSGCDVSDETARALAELPNLRLIDLSNTKVTDEGLKCFQSSKSLVQINVLGCSGVTSTGIATFTEISPQISVAGDVRLEELRPQDIRRLAGATQLWQRCQPETLTRVACTPVFSVELESSVPMSDIQYPEVLDEIVISMEGHNWVTETEAIDELRQRSSELQKLRPRLKYLKSVRIVYRHRFASEKMMQEVLVFPFTKLRVNELKLDGRDCPDGELPTAVAEFLAKSEGHYSLEVIFPTPRLLESLASPRVTRVQLERVGDELDCGFIKYFGKAVSLEIHDEFLTHLDLNPLSQSKSLRSCFINCPQLDSSAILPLYTTEQYVSSTTRPLNVVDIQYLLDNPPKGDVIVGPVDVNLFRSLEAPFAIPAQLRFRTAFNIVLTPSDIKMVELEMLSNEDEETPRSGE